MHAVQETKAIFASFLSNKHIKQDPETNFERNRVKEVSFM